MTTIPEGRVEDNIELNLLRNVFWRYYGWWSRGCRRGRSLVMVCSEWLHLSHGTKRRVPLPPILPSTSAGRVKNMFRGHNLASSAPYRVWLFSCHPWQSFPLPVFHSTSLPLILSLVLHSLFTQHLASSHEHAACIATQTSHPFGLDCSHPEQVLEIRHVCCELSELGIQVR